MAAFPQERDLHFVARCVCLYVGQWPDTSIIQIRRTVMADQSIKVLSTEKRVFPPSKEFSQKAHIKSMQEYEQLYKRSVDDPDKFWGEMAEKNLTWSKKWTKVLDYDFHKPYIK
jgi:hypothetical protein